MRQLAKLAIPELDSVFRHWNCVERFYDKDDGLRNRRHTEKWYQDRIRIASVLDKLARIEKHALKSLECLCN